MPDVRGRFVRGEHWRRHQVFHEREWLECEYVAKQRSAADIAAEFGVTDSAILHWLRRHGIQRRSIEQARSIKHWGPMGTSNPMYGKVGSLNGNWKGGASPERQRFYSSLEWRDAIRVVRARDGDICQECGAAAQGHRALAIHHIIPFEISEYRSDVANLITLCATCHRAVHARKGGKP